MTKKKAKSKKNAKSKKKAARKVAKKAVKKVAGKAKTAARKPPARAAGAPKRKPSAPAPSAKIRKPGQAPLPAEKQVVDGVLLGQVEDYFAHVNVMAVKLLAPVSVGDMIRIKGHTTDIPQNGHRLQDLSDILRPAHTHGWCLGSPRPLVL